MEHPVPYVSGGVVHVVFVKCCPLFLSYILVKVAANIYVVHRLHNEANFFVGEVKDRHLLENECIVKWLEVEIVFRVVVMNECLVSYVLSKECSIDFCPCISFLTSCFGDKLKLVPVIVIFKEILYFACFGGFMLKELQTFRSFIKVENLNER